MGLCSPLVCPTSARIIDCYHRLREQTYGSRVGRMGEGIDKEFWMDMYSLLYLKWVTKSDLPFNTWNSAQCYVVAWMEGECIHVHEWLSPFTVLK